MVESDTSNHFKCKSICCHAHMHIDYIAMWQWSVASNQFNKTCFILIWLNYTTIIYLVPLLEYFAGKARPDPILYLQVRIGCLHMRILSTKSYFSFASTRWAPSLCQDLGMDCLSWWQQFFQVEVLLSVSEDHRNKFSQRKRKWNLHKFYSKYSHNRSFISSNNLFFLSSQYYLCLVYRNYFHPISCRFNFLS